jgi:inosine-uridine nucleoside N-ribohydrolase
MRVLLDTDIGNNPDDALCLAYLLARPDCELLGITTVTGEAERRASLASALCAAFGREVPILPGAEQPLAAPQRQPHAPQAALLERWPHATHFPRGQAIPFLRATIRRYPGEVRLLAIGALTNVARLFAADSEIPGLLAGLTLMAGNFAPAAPPDTNARNDPEAAEQVYAARVAVHRSVGKDITGRLTLDAATAAERMQGPGLAILRDFAGDWLATGRPLVFNDPLAAATLFVPEVCRFAGGRVQVALEAGERRGATSWQPGGPEAPHEVAVAVEPERFFAHYLDVLAGRSTG